MTASLVNNRSNLLVAVECHLDDLSQKSTSEQFTRAEPNSSELLATLNNLREVFRDFVLPEPTREDDRSGHPESLLDLAILRIRRGDSYELGEAARLIAVALESQTTIPEKAQQAREALADAASAVTAALHRATEREREKFREIAKKRDKWPAFCTRTRITAESARVLLDLEVGTGAKTSFHTSYGGVPDSLHVLSERLFVLAQSAILVSEHLRGSQHVPPWAIAAGHLTCQIDEWERWFDVGWEMFAYALGADWDGVGHPDTKLKWLRTIGFHRGDPAGIRSEIKSRIKTAFRDRFFIFKALELSPAKMQRTKTPKVPGDGFW